MKRTVLKEDDSPLKIAIVEKYGSVQDFAYIWGIDRSSLYYIFRKGKQKYLQDDMLLTLSMGLEMSQQEIKQMCCREKLCMNN